MHEFDVQLPHEIYISLLFLEGYSVDAINEKLELNDLALPSDTYLKEIQSLVNPKPPRKQDEVPEELTNKMEHLSPAEGNTEFIEKLKYIQSKTSDEVLNLLRHPDRELIDVVCILNRRDPSKIKSELEQNDIYVSLNVIKMYVTLFWQPSAIDSRHRWRIFLRGLVDESEHENTGYESNKNLYKLARIGDEDLVFWKLQRPKNTRNKKQDLEQVREMLTFKILETKYMSNNINNSKLIANLSSQLVDITKQLHDMETESDFENIVEYLKNNVELENPPEKELKSLEEVTKENSEMADIVPMNKKENK